jgi:integrase
MPRSKRYPGTIVKRGDSFRIYLCVGGKRHTATLRTTDRREAERFAIEKAEELKRVHDRRRMGLPGSMAFSALVDLFERQEMPALSIGTQQAYRESLTALKPYFVNELGDPQLERIHAKHVAGFLAWRRVNRLKGKEQSQGHAKPKPREPISNRTLQKDRAVLHRVFNMAERMEFREGNPVARVPAPKADPREPVILSATEYEKLIAECAGRPMLELYVLVMGESGLRSESEALHLRWPDVELRDQGGFLWVSSAQKGHRTKSGKGRHVPLTPRLAAALREHFAAYRFAGSPWIFHHLTSRYHFKRGERIGSMRRAFRNAVTRAKLPERLHQHDLRHRRVTTWLAEGRDVVLVKEAMGHSDLRTTMGYTHLAKEHLSALVDAPARSEPGTKTG